ncbi:ATP-dependent RNA helicase ddx25 [Mactra antiquata]
MATFCCPTGWELHDNICYLFERDNQLIYEEADAYCWVKGARLLSINGYVKHKYISDWLLKHDMRDNTWYTSGEYYQGVVSWNHNQYQSDRSQQFWASGKLPLPTTRFFRVAYVRGGPQMDGYGWEVVSPSIKSAFICEMSRTDAQEMKIESRDFTYGQGNTNIKNIERGPVITEQPESVVVFENPPSALIECKAIGNPIPHFEWRRDGNTDVTSQLNNRYTLSAGRFTIQDPVENEDRGEYQCSVENKYGKILSNPATIIFGYLHGFSPVKPEDVQANKFEGSRISCQAPAGFPDVTYSWFMNDVSQPIFSGDQNFFISSSGYLYFSEVQPTDFRKYYCSVTLISTSLYKPAISQSPSRFSLGVQLIVTGTEHGYFKPFIYTHTFPSPALKGSRIRLECIAYGSLPLRYSWRREDGRPFEKGTTLSDRNRVLTIVNAQLESEGNYICTVNGKAGVTSKVLGLSVEAKPYFPFDIGDRLADPGQTLKWRCAAVARPAAVYTWYKDGELIETVPGKIEIKRNLLLIHNVDITRDEGMYQCGATNVHGTTFSYGQLKVLSFMPTFDKNPLPQFVQMPEGGNYSIPCKVEAAPVPDVVWMKSGSVLPLTPGDINGHIGMTLENAIVFNDVMFSDAGIYTCKATNVNGEAINTTRVEVVRGISISEAPRDTRVMSNRTAFLYCQASYDSLHFDLTYQWKINGHVIDLKNNYHFIQTKRDNLDGLYIRQAQFEHTGLYTCEAKTTLHIDSKSAYLYVNGPPGAPAGAYVVPATVRPDSARLVWTITPAINHGSPVTMYDIEAELGLYPGRWEVIASDVSEILSSQEAKTFGLREEQRSIVVNGLLPNIDYRFRVRAINDYGRGQEASRGSVSIKTPSTAPVVAPRNIRGLDEGKVGTLNIMWDPLDESEYSGTGVGYNVYFKKADEPKDFFHAKVNGSTSNMYTHLVGEENYYLDYEVKIGAFNTHGSGPNSSLTVVKSAEGMPIATVMMGDCDNYNGSAFSMSWTAVEDTREVMKGRLKGYRIRYWHKEHPDFITWRDLYGQHEETIIIGLEDNTNYWASVQVMNYAGVGPIGEIRLAETFHLPPQAYPRHVQVWPRDKHSVTVKWQGISTTSVDEETLQGYIVRIWKIQEDIRTARDIVVDKDPVAVVDNLQIQTVYVLRVLGYSIGGDGSLSPHVYFTVEGGNVPFDPTTTEFCFDRTMCGTASNINYSFILLLIVRKGKYRKGKQANFIYLKSGYLVNYYRKFKIMADDWGAIVDEQEKNLTKKVDSLNIAGNAASGGDRSDVTSTQPAESQGAEGGAVAGAGDSTAPKVEAGASGESDEKETSAADESLLRKILHSKIVPTKAELDILQKDPNSPLYSIKSFDALNLKPELLKGVYEMGFNAPSKIQETALPTLLADPPTNMIAQSQSGTGKTAAFTLTMLSRVDSNLPYTQCLCLAPTYELALQIGSVTEKMAKHMPTVKIGYAVKGERIPRGQKCMDHILIGTPGTVLDWALKFKNFDPKKLKVFVLDEADVMIALQGHQGHSIKIQRQLSKTCQMLLFSATYEEEVMRFAQAVIPNSPIVIRLRRDEETLDNIRQFYVQCQDQEDKFIALSNIYGAISIGQSMIFCATRRTAHWLSEKMTKDGHAVALLSGDLDIGQRAAIINRFRDGKEKVLITTNVSARGIDVEMVTVVVNFDLPILQDTKQADCETYLHRIGRTGRFGKAGLAINMIDSNKSLQVMKAIEKHFGRTIERLDTDDVEAIEKIST